MKRLFLTLVAVALFFTNGYSSENTGLSEREKNLSHVMYVMDEIRALKLPLILKKGEMIYDQDGNFKGRYILKEDMSSGRIGFNSYVFTAQLITQGYSGEVVGYSNPAMCNDNVMLTWEGDRVSKVSSRNDNYFLVYDNEGKIIQAIETYPHYDYTKQIVLEEIDITYEKDRVISLKRMKKVGKGKSLSKVKWKFSYMAFEKSYSIDPAANTTKVTVTEYKTKKKEKDPVAVLRTESIQSERHEDHFTVENLQAPGLSTRPYVTVSFDGKNVTRVESNRADSKTVTEYLYNSRGWVEKESTKQFNKGELETHSELSYTYKKKSEKNTDESVCNYEATTFTQKLNAEGQVIEEADMGKVRKRKDDGTWGAWERYTY